MNENNETPTFTTSPATQPPWSATEAARLAAATADYDNEKKSAGVAYALWFFLGVFGGHRFYAGDTGLGLGQLLTLGGLGFWSLIDVFLIGSRIQEINRSKRAEVFARYNLPV